MIAPARTAWDELPGRARKEARSGTALWPEAAVAGIAWARLSSRHFDRSIRVMLAIWALMVIVLTLRAPAGSFELAHVIAYAFGLVVAWIGPRHQTYQRIEARLIRAATACLPDDDQPVELRAIYGVRERLVSAGIAAAVGATCAYQSRGSGITEAILIPLTLLAAAVFAAPFRLDDARVRLDASGLHLAARRRTIPWRLIDGVDLIDPDGTPKLRWAVRDADDVTVALSAIGGGAEDAVLATKRYLRVRIAVQPGDHEVKCTLDGVSAD